MGKGTDKLYITHSEWASEDAYSANAGSAVNRSRKGGAPLAFKQLPFNYCALSLQPFKKRPVCTLDGTTFDFDNITSWIAKHGTHPVTGQPIKDSDLTELHLEKNEAGEYVDPVTFKVLTVNTHIVAIRSSGNVFAWDTVERLNIKPRMWRDLVTDQEFSRKDIIHLQDPHNPDARNTETFAYLKDSLPVPGRKEEKSGINYKAIGSYGKVLQEQQEATAPTAKSQEKPEENRALTKASEKTVQQARKAVPYNAARHTTGKAAASFTSTGLTPHTSAELALLTDEQYMLRRGRIKIKGYARMSTTIGDLFLELHTEYAPKAVWNFIQLARKEYYKGVAFHRNIKGFMIQGGDPSGTGRGGQSIWGKPFDDEVDNPLKHDSRGTVSMANKGKNTNSSQFFFAYRALPHLDRKHTIFGRLIDEPTSSSTTLSSMEVAPVDEGNKPVSPIKILDIDVLVDPFEEFIAQSKGKKLTDDPRETGNDADSKSSRALEDETMTWTGKSLQQSTKPTAPTNEGGGRIGKYVQSAKTAAGSAKRDLEPPSLEGDPAEDFAEYQHAQKKMKTRSGGFGNFDSW